MSDAKDTLLRQLALLRLIPREPQRRATSTLLEKLREQGFSVSQRTLQRDLVNLSGPFALLCDAQPAGNRWSYMRDAPLDLSAMDTPTALALYLAESHLQSLLPQIVLDQLAPQFSRARHHLDGLQHNDLAHWARRVRAMPNGKALLPAQINPDVWRAASTALMERRQLRITYLSRSKSEHKVLTLHPVGLVSRHAISYLIATANHYKDLRQYALHRIEAAAALDARAHESESPDIDRYIQAGGFNNPGPVEETELVADISPQIAAILNETRLSPDQEMEPLPNSDWQRLRARVPMDQETLWWLFGLGENVRVHEPLNWSQAIMGKTVRMKELYAQ
jgi:predicted DNA-binding transcriptional regulator YafY